LRNADVDREELAQWQPGPVVDRLPAWPRDPGLTLEVALLTNCLTRLGVEPGGVHNGVGGGGCVAAGVCRRVQLARPVAALAANPVAREDRLDILADPAGHGVDLVRVAEQAIGGDGPLEMLVSILVAGCQVPNALLRVPAHR